MSQQHPRPASSSRRAVFAWWRRTGEPAVLTMFGISAFTLPVLVLLDVLSFAQVMRAAVVLGWLAGGLLLLRLPRILRHERYRIAVLGAISVFAVVAALIVTMFPRPLSQPQDGDAALAAVLSALQEEAQGNAASGELASPHLQAGQLTFVSRPRISADMFAYVLQRGIGAGPSPAAPYAYDLYNIVVSYGLDPAVALAFFAHESQLCKTGVCITNDTKGWGAQRAAYRSSRAIGYAPGPFVRYRTWQDGLRDWCELILYGYVGRGLDTVEKAIPVYAPTSDGNVPTSYIATVRRLVANWQGRPIVAGPPAPDVPRVYTGGLENALTSETFRATGLEFHSNWAFHHYALDEARAGRSLGSPLDESRVITVDGKKYAVQTFALDTLYTPLAEDMSQTNWNDVQRFSALLKQNKPTATPVPSATAAPPSGTPKALPTTTSQQGTVKK
jgi:hypothetical protein